MYLRQHLPTTFYPLYVSIRYNNPSFPEANLSEFTKDPSISNDDMKREICLLSRLNLSVWTE